jgi:hypothetical protein
MIKALPARCDVASAVASLANELLTTFPDSRTARRCSIASGDG